MKNQNDLYKYENELIRTGVRYIAGIDEVGRGPLAGGVLACACILDLAKPIVGIDDSKKLTEKRRQALTQAIKNSCVDYAYGYVDEKVIDQINIYQASKLAMMRAIESLKVRPDHLLIDAMHLDVDIPQTSLIKGDALSVSIGAASILAKVKRDEIMIKFNELYPGYGFDQHKGYPTKLHLQKLNELKPCAIHRQSYQPVKDALATQLRLDLEE